MAETSEIAVCNGEILKGFEIKREEIVLDLGSADFRSLYIVETKTVTPSVVLDAPPAEMMLLFLLLV